MRGIARHLAMTASDRLFTPHRLHSLADLPGRFPVCEHAADSRRPAQAGESIKHNHKSLRQ
jgi:hypothetical protein